MDAGARPFSLMVVDDNIFLTQSLERWFTATGSARWLGSAAQASAVPALVSRNPPDVLLLDVDIPGSDTFALLRQLVSEFPSVKVVMFSGHARGNDIETALGAGAWGYIVKDEPAGAILDLLLQAVSGECVLSPQARAAWSARR